MEAFYSLSAAGKKILLEDIKSGVPFPDYFVMDNVGLEFQQKVPVFWVVFRPFDIFSGETADHVHIRPERQRDEVRDVAFITLENMYAYIAWDGLVIRDRPPIQEFTVSLCFC